MTGVKKTNNSKNMSMINLGIKYTNFVLEQNALIVISHILMNKTIIQNAEDSRFFVELNFL